MSLAVRLGNGGTLVPPAPVRVAFYRGDPAAGGTLLGEIEVPDQPAPGWRELGLDGIPVGAGELYAVADPQGAVDECDEGNNALSIPGDAAQSLGALTLSTDAASYGPASPVAIAVQASNPGSFPALYRLELVVEDAAGNPVATPTLPPLGDPLAPGATAERTAAWATGTTLAGDYRLVGQLYDASGVAGAPRLPAADGTRLAESAAAFRVAEYPARVLTCSPKVRPTQRSPAQRAGTCLKRLPLFHRSRSAQISPAFPLCAQPCQSRSVSGDVGNSQARRSTGTWSPSRRVAQRAIAVSRGANQRAGIGSPNA